MEGVGRQFVVGWTEGKGLCSCQTSSIPTQSRSSSRILDCGGNSSASLPLPTLLSPGRRIRKRFTDCEPARAISCGPCSQFSRVDMAEIIGLQQVAAPFLQYGNSTFLSRFALRSATQLSPSLEEFSKPRIRRSFPSARSALSKSGFESVGGRESAGKSFPTAIREANSSGKRSSFRNAVQFSSKSESSDYQTSVQNPTEAVFELSRSSRNTCKQSLGFVDSTKRFPGKLLGATQKTHSKALNAFDKTQVLQAALTSSRRYAESSALLRSSVGSPVPTPGITLRIVAKTSAILPIRKSVSSSLTQKTWARIPDPSEASSPDSSDKISSVLSSGEFTRRTDATQSLNRIELLPPSKDSPRRSLNSPVSTGTTVTFSSGSSLSSSPPNSSSSRTISETTEESYVADESRPRRIPSPARSPRSRRKDHGQAFPSSETLDRLHQQLEEQARDSSSKVLEQEPMGPEESERLWERLKEQKQKSIREIHRRLFRQRQHDDGQGDEFSCAVDPESLMLGEYVVHKRVGVGKYIGTKSEVPSGKVNPSMYIYLKYADGVAKLKAKQAHRLLYRYHLAGDIGGTPSLSKLKDTSVWEKKKNKGKIAIQKMVVNMMELYIHRLKQSRHPYPKDSIAMAEFAAKFPHTPTPDQVQAFADVERDMTELDLPMDRLICGDVGFGKTEVALRALFVTVEAGKQAMVLAPSTVLAKQHYETIRDRFASYPEVKVALLCRFQKESVRKDLIVGIHDGSLSIVVGTHSLLGSQIRYNNLGLLVIDEEQRFGVKQKEKISCLRSSVDVLTLSATPIPRTLYLAMSGFRDTSLLTTPPPERRPIQTHLMEYNEAQVTKAIQFELDRGGQVFYVVPRVKGIENLHQTIQCQFPEVDVAIAHGKQSASALEEAMQKFCDGETKILLCTNIIESGLDIRTVNTIIVEDVHLFGLAQLYQLRGRVGRAQREAHAYLCHPHKSHLTDEALERLVALQDCCELSQGFQLAERDMAIRGIGNLFGEQQSGDAAQIGSDLYFEMLLEGLSKVDSQRLPSVHYEDVQLELGVDAHVPSDYINSPEEREAAFRAAERAAKVSLRALMLCTNRLRDKYGKEPAAMEMLLKTIYVRRMAADLGIHRIRIQGTAILMETNITFDAFEMITSCIPSESIRSSLTFESGCIKMQGLIGLPKERQMERVFCCLADMFNGLPSFVKCI